MINNGLLNEIILRVSPISKFGANLQELLNLSLLTASDPEKAIFSKVKDDYYFAESFDIFYEQGSRIIQLILFETGDGDLAVADLWSPQDPFNRIKSIDFVRVTPS